MNLYPRHIVDEGNLFQHWLSFLTTEIMIVIHIILQFVITRYTVA